jgi:hypothetical protein
VKAITISISILLLTCLILTFAYAQPPGYGPPQQLPTKTQEHRHKERKQATDANDVNDANAPAEANEPKYKMYEGLEDELIQLDEEADKEMHEWARGDAESKIESRIKLVEAVQEQVLAELQFVKDLAVEEKAEKTAAAIDGLIANRQKRFDDVLEKLEKRRQQEKKREDRRTRDREPTRRTRSTRPTMRPGGGPPME